MDRRLNQICRMEQVLNNESMGAAFGSLVRYLKCQTKENLFHKDQGRIDLRNWMSLTMFPTRQFFP